MKVYKYMNPLFRHCLFRIYEGLRAPRGISFFWFVKLHVEYRQNHVWGPPGARAMTIFVKHIFLERLNWFRPMVEKSAKNYIEWRSQNTKRLIEFWSVL